MPCRICGRDVLTNNAPSKSLPPHIHTKIYKTTKTGSARLKSRDVLQAKAAAKYAMAAVRKEQLRDRGRDIE